MKKYIVCISVALMVMVSLTSISLAFPASGLYRTVETVTDSGGIPVWELFFSPIPGRESLYLGSLIHSRTLGTVVYIWKKKLAINHDNHITASAIPTPIKIFFALPTPSSPLEKKIK